MMIGKLCLIAGGFSLGASVFGALTGGDTTRASFAALAGVSCLVSGSLVEWLMQRTLQSRVEELSSALAEAEAKLAGQQPPAKPRNAKGRFTKDFTEDASNNAGALR